MKSIGKTLAFLFVTFVGFNVSVVGQQPRMSAPHSPSPTPISQSPSDSVIRIASAYRFQDELPPPQPESSGEELPLIPSVAPRNPGSQTRNSIPMGSGVETIYPEPSMSPSMGTPMTMPPSYQQAPCCAAHGLNTNMEPAYSSVVETSISDSNQRVFSTAGSCGGQCGGGCVSCQNTLINQLGNQSVGMGLGTNLPEMKRMIRRGGPTYAFFDVGGFFSRGDSQFDSRPPIFGHKDNLLVGAGLGRYLTKDFRFDVSGRYRYVETEKGFRSPGFGRLAIDGGSHAWTAMLNGRHNLPGWHPCIKPYVSVGVGVAFHQTHATTNIQPNGFIPGLSTPILLGHLSDDSTEFAWSAGAGVAFKMTRNMFFDFDYQFIDLGDAASGPNATGTSVTFNDLTANEVAFRLRFNF